MSTGYAQTCAPSWQENRDNHIATDLTENMASLIFLADQMKDEIDFELHLNSILMPRAVESSNHTIVGTYIIQQMESLGWTVETDEFSQDTVVGERSFKNIIATHNPNSPRRLVIGTRFS